MTQPDASAVSILIPLSANHLTALPSVMVLGNLICFGFDCAEDGPNFNIYKGTNGYATSDTIVHQTVWAKQIYAFMQKNQSINFRFVEGNLPKAFFELDNCKAITYNELNTIIDEKENG